MRSGKAQGAEPQNGGGMTTRSRENGYERQCNMLHGGATWRCGGMRRDVLRRDSFIGDRTETVACGLGIAHDSYELMSVGVIDAFRLAYNTTV